MAQMSMAEAQQAIIRSPTSRFGLIEGSVVHHSGRRLTPSQSARCSKHRFNQKLRFSSALLKPLPLPFTVRPYAGQPTEQGPVSSGGLLTDICPHKQGPVQRGGLLLKVKIEIHHLDRTWPRCDAEWPIVSALGAVVLSVTLREPFSILG